MPRAPAILLTAALMVLTAAGGVLFFSYGWEDTPPAQVEIAGLEAPATISWQEEKGVARIHADSRRDAFAALGFVHGSRRAWMTLLLRQTALGRLAEWYGKRALALDSLTRRLGLADFARRTYTALPDSQQTLLEAYARGMNAALQVSHRRVSSAAPLLFLGVEPIPWEPWHTLAIERLFAWLSAEPPGPERLAPDASGAAARMGHAVRTFFSADRRLHRWLALHGFESSLAFAMRDTAGTHFYQRQVYGASARAPYQAVLLTIEGHAPLMGASLLGTPFFVAGRTGRQAWAVLPSSALTLERVPADTTAALRSHERLTTSGGIEHLLAVRRRPGLLPLGEPSAPGDSLWAVRWPGFRPGTDLDAFLTLMNGDGRGAFRLLEGDGLRVDGTGDVAIMGRPQVVERLPTGVLVGNTAWAHSAADQLRALAARDGPAAVERWIDSDSSAWAARAAPVLMASLDSLARLHGGALTTEQSTGVFHEALTYLRNWGYRYDRTSIGASIFDTWMTFLPDSVDFRQLPAAPIPDTTRRATWQRRYQALQRAVASLVKRFGRDLRQWRWARVAPDVRYFPGWRADSLLGAVRIVGRTRYAPIRLPGRGHPSSLSWGASPLGLGPPAPAGWEAWISTSRWSRLHVRRRRFDIDAFLSRYRLPHDRPPPITIEANPAARSYTTRLVPLQ